MVSQDEKNTEPAQTPSAHARSQPLKQATWWGQSKTAGLWGNVSDTDWGEGAAWIADWVCKTDSLAFEPDTVPGWQGCHCSSGRCRGSLGHTLKEGKCCRNCLPGYLTLQLCTQLNTQISEEPLPQAVMPRHLKMSAITGLGNGGTRWRKLINISRTKIG